MKSTHFSFETLLLLFVSLKEFVICGFLSEFLSNFGLNKFVVNFVRYLIQNYKEKMKRLKLKKLRYVCVNNVNYFPI